MGMSNMIATIPGFVVPAFVGALTHTEVRWFRQTCLANIC